MNLTLNQNMCCYFTLGKSCGAGSAILAQLVLVWCWCSIWQFSFFNGRNPSEEIDYLNSNVRFCLTEAQDYCTYDGFFNFIFSPYSYGVLALSTTIRIYEPCVHDTFPEVKEHCEDKEGKHEPETKLKKH